MAQRPRIEVPAGWGGKSITVSPVGGRLFLYFKLGITREEEQSKVAFVCIFKVVAVAALAVVFLGSYPPLAVIFIVCVFPFRITLFVSWVELVFAPSGFVKITKAMIMVTNATAVGISIFFIYEMSE